MTTSSIGCGPRTSVPLTRWGAIRSTPHARRAKYGSGRSIRSHRAHRRAGRSRPRDRRRPRRDRELPARPRARRGSRLLRRVGLSAHDASLGASACASGSTSPGAPVAAPRGSTITGQCAPRMRWAAVLPTRIRRTGPHPREPKTSRSTWADRSASSSTVKPRKTRPPISTSSPRSPAGSSSSADAFASSFHPGSYRPVSASATGEPATLTTLTRASQARASATANASAWRASGRPSNPTPIRVTASHSSVANPRGGLRPPGGRRADRAGGVVATDDAVACAPHDDDRIRGRAGHHALDSRAVRGPEHDERGLCPAPPHGAGRGRPTSRPRPGTRRPGYPPAWTGPRRASWRRSRPTSSRRAPRDLGRRRAGRTDVGPRLPAASPRDARGARPADRPAAIHPGAAGRAVHRRGSRLPARALGRSGRVGLDPRSHSPWWPPSKIAGRFLPSYLTVRAGAPRAPEVRPAADVIPVQVDIADAIARGHGPVPSA